MLIGKAYILEYSFNATLAGWIRRTEDVQINHNCPLTPLRSCCNVSYIFHMKQTPPFSGPYFQTLQHPPWLLSATKLFGNFPLVVSMISLLSFFFLTHPGFGPLNFHLNLPVTLVLLISCSVLHTTLFLGTQCAPHSSDSPSPLVLPALCSQQFTLPCVF